MKSLNGLPPEILLIPLRGHTYGHSGFAIQSGDKVTIVSWISQTFLQLVLLSVIIVEQNVQAAASDARAEADHQTLNAVHTLTSAVYAINEQQTEILRRLGSKL